ncbi:hypothetical protein SDC9_116026 [bioreactor metagenome]|uniref:Toxin HigB-2 n=1 Tax=bioreactor metagenome TaxID=1076179 RepID=A0A645BUZ9_9ZZZZ
MRIFKNAWFERFARRQGIEDEAIVDAIQRAEHGLIDADLGGGVIKQRVARPGHGKSGGFRTVILYRTAERAFLVYGFAKSDRDNLGKDEEAQFRKVAGYVLGLSDEQLAALIDKGQFVEVLDDKEIPE